VKSDLVGRGGRACRDIEAFTQLSLWAEFFGSCCVGAGAFAGASLLALATRPRYSPSRLTVAPHPRVSPSRPALAPRPRASPSRRIKPRHSARQCALILAFAPRPRSRLTLALRPRLSPSPLALASRPRLSPSPLALASRPLADLVADGRSSTTNIRHRRVGVPHFRVDSTTHDVDDASRPRNLPQARQSTPKAITTSPRRRCQPARCYMTVTI